MQAAGNHTWEIAVPSGPYTVLVAAGDPSSTNGLYRIAAEGVPLVDGSPASTNRWLEGLGTVIVTDGKLSLTSGAGAISNRLDYVEISALEPATIAQWRALFFGTTNNSGVAADTANPDGDGQPNLLEYAFGLDPTHLDSGAQLSAVVVPTNNATWFGCSFPRNTNATDLVVQVQAADSLSLPAWLSIASYSGNGSGWTGPARVWEQGCSPGRVSVSVLDTRQVPSGTNHFLRLWVSHL
jgi:hypothetical protein